MDGEETTVATTQQQETPASSEASPAGVPQSTEPTPVLARTTPPGKTTEQKVAIALDLKEEGNQFVKQQQWSKALFAYHRALLHVKGLEPDSSLASFMKGSSMGSLTADQTKTIQSLMQALHVNMALCHAKQSKFDKVVYDCDKALQIGPNNVKALFRRGQAYLHLRDSDRAAVDLNKAAELDPQDKAIQAELRRLKEFDRVQLEKQKKTYAGIFERMSKEDS